MSTGSIIELTAIWPWMFDFVRLDTPGLLRANRKQTTNRNVIQAKRRNIQASWGVIQADRSDIQLNSSAVTSIMYKNKSI